MTAKSSRAEPALCRRILQATGAGSPPAFVRECLAQGVENLQLEAGIDTDADGLISFVDLNSQAMRCFCSPGFPKPAVCAVRK